MTSHTFKPVQTDINFPEKEKELLKHWYDSGIVDKYLHKNDSSKTTFSFMDGPITANNPMGVHHAWGRTYKDLWQRFHTMLGDRERYQNGFDCQGLWVEVEVEKDLGFKTKKDIETFGVANFVEKCKERVLKYSGIQTEQSKRLGYFMDWDHSYYTMSNDNNYTIWHFLKVCFDRGWIYKGHESIPWCPRCETAISQHEMLTEDYKELTHESIILEFPLEDRENEFLLVWTTTPWTIPGNIVVAVDEEADYSLVEGSFDPKYKHWIATPLINSVFEGKPGKILKTVKGKELVGLRYRSAFDGLESVEKARKENPELFHTVVATDNLLMPITMHEGTGMVHTAVSAGEEDFKLGKKLGLPMIPIIADNADYLPGLENFLGKNAKKHPEIILDFLRDKEEKEKSWVFRIFPYTHRYPACWRCKTELVWKVADEWYIAMDKADPTDPKKRTLRHQLQDTTKNVNWLPSFGLDRELDWLKNMHDWLISKPNRYWGLALPIYECKKCGHFEVVGGKEELKEKAIEGWDKFDGHTPHRPWIDEVKITCSECGAEVSRILDVGNPWLDAGIVPFSTIAVPNDSEPLFRKNKKEFDTWYPVDFITESFPGQFKNWFYSMLVMGTVLEKKNSFENCLGYGSLLAEDGRPMHKSWGNSIEFNEGADKIGVDVMRWMYSRANPSDNLLFGYKKADEVRRQFFLILWNSYNYFITYALLDAWTPSNKKVEVSVLDHWILSRLNQTLKTVTDGLNKYDAQIGALSLESFVSDLSTWYVRRSRDRTDKQAFYQTMYEVLTTLSKILAPFMPFVSEEMYRNLTGEESVHLADWPQAGPVDEKLEEEMKVARSLVELAHADRKASQIKVRQPLSLLETKSSLELRPEILDLIKAEVNVKKVTNKKGELGVKLDKELTPDLIAEGEAREIVRSIQDARKELKTKMDEEVVVTLPSWPKDFESYIKEQTLAKELKVGDTLKVERLG